MAKIARDGKMWRKFCVGMSEAIDLALRRPSRLLAAKRKQACYVQYVFQFLIDNSE
jgi:hypothetical protein